MCVALLSCLPQFSKATEPTATPSESLTYNVYFHLGFIWAKAGQGILSLSPSKDPQGNPVLQGKLAAKSLSIVEHIMKVRDTLMCTFTPDYLVTGFEKHTHEGKYNCIERNTYRPYFHPGSAATSPSDVDSTQVSIYRWLKKGKEPSSVDNATHSVEEPAYDMLSLFYVIRRLDFDQLKSGQTFRYACFSGLKKDWINVEFKGEEAIKLRSGARHDAFRVDLTFATKGQDSTPLNVWLAKTSDHRPLKVIIGLKRIGSVQGEIVE